MMKHTVAVMMNTVYTAKLWADRQYDRARLTLSYPNLVQFFYRIIFFQDIDGVSRTGFDLHRFFYFWVNYGTY